MNVEHNDRINVTYAGRINVTTAGLMVLLRKQNFVKKIEWQVI
jgi:hypothetical protein